MQYSEEVQQQMFSMIESWQQSGLNQKTWCEQHNILYHVFHYWYRKFRGSQLAPAALGEHSFIPLQLKPVAMAPDTPSSAASVHTELVLVDGRRVRFHQGVSADYLKVLIS